MLSFYKRIFPNPAFQYLAKGTMAFVIISTALFAFLQIFQCRPIQFIWEGWKAPDQPHQCFQVNVLVYGAAAASILQDLVILVLPLPLLAKLNTGLKTKLGIILMFSLGIFVLITSILRLRYFVSFGDSANPTWDYTDPLLWSGLEVSVSIIVACLPAIRVLFQSLLPRNLRAILFSRNTKSGYVKEASGHSNSLNERHGQRRPRRYHESISRMFSSHTEATSSRESQLELGLHLGDRIQGEVQTEILADKEVSLNGNQRNLSGEGIHVVTTTTRVVGGGE